MMLSFSLSLKNNYTRLVYLINYYIKPARYVIL